MMLMTMIALKTMTMRSIPLDLQGERLRWRLRASLTAHANQALFKRGTLLAVVMRSNTSGQSQSADGLASLDVDQRLTGDLDDFCRFACALLGSSYRMQSGALTTIASAAISLQYVASGVGGPTSIYLALGFAIGSTAVLWLLLSPVAGLTASADLAKGATRFAWDRLARNAEAVVLGRQQADSRARLDRLADMYAWRSIRLYAWLCISETWGGF